MVERNRSCEQMAKMWKDRREKECVSWCILSGTAVKESRQWLWHMIYFFRLKVLSESVASFMEYLPQYWFHKLKASISTFYICQWQFIEIRDPSKHKYRQYNCTELRINKHKKYVFVMYLCLLLVSLQLIYLLVNSF